ncbi:unnamed protein product [Pleuronectes platessa]|uniref:Uncharacterized protein n=1 Tax=Pleuronectes platessa TaxID=8262 RepID=A0A9N7Y8D8_PLEPL|nr:unnamed protein product [Pleuronectes platessa]
MRVDILKDNPNTTCQAVPLRSQSMVSNQQDHDPPSRPERHSSPQSLSTAAHQDPSRATTAVLVHRPYPMPMQHRIRHQHHDQPTRHRILHTNANPNTAIHGAATEALDLQGDKAKGFRGRGIEMEKRKEKLEREAPCVINSFAS